MSDELWSNDLPRVMSRNLIRAIQARIRPGEDIQVAINHELQAVLVFSDQRTILSCRFEDLLHDPTATLN